MIQKDMLNYAKRYHVLPIVKKITIMQFINLFINICIAFEIAKVFSSLFNEGDFHLTPFYFVYLFSLLAVKSFCHYYSTKWTHYTSHRLKHRLRRELFEKLLTFSPRQITELETSKISQLAVEGIENIDVYYSRYMPQFFYSLGTPVILFAVMSFIHWKIALLLVISGFLIPVAIVAGVKIGKRIFKTYWNKYLNVGKRFVEGVEGMQTLKIYNGDEAFQEIMNQESEDFRIMTMRVLRMQLQSITIMDLIAYFGTALGIFCSVLAFRNGNLDLFGFVCFAILSVEFFLPFRLLGSFFHVGLNGVSSLQLLSSILEKETVVHKGEVPFKGNGDLLIRHLTYAYPNADQPVLKDCEFMFRNGTVTGIAGASGSGKTTLTNIIQRFLEPSQGEMLLGETDLGSMPPEQLHQLIGSVGSRPHIFEGTIYTNLMMAKPDLTKEEGKEILEFVKLCQFADQLEHPVQSGGTNLSSGQKQKLAIARMLLKNPQVLLFDEATANIDRQSEDDIFAIIHDISRQGKTVIVITHQLHRLQKADQVYLIDGGKVRERGTHEELLACQAVYAELFEEQQTMGRCLA